MYISTSYRVYQAEYGIHFLVAASQEYVNTYSTRRLPTHAGLYAQRPCSYCRSRADRGRVHEPPALAC